MKKQAKPKPTVTPQDDTQLQTRVLLEEIRSEVKIVGEQHGTVIKKLDNIDAKLSQHDEGLQIIKVTVRSNSGELKSVKLSVNELDGKVESLDAKVADNTSQIKELQAGQQEINRKLDTVITDHEHRLQKLETVR